MAAVAPALEPLDETLVDRDLWSVPHWMTDGIGGERTADALHATGRVFRVPVSMDADRSLS
jgi:hypothetical protein